jgi:hypothetical protein
VDKTTEKRAITDLNLPNVAVSWEIYVEIGPLFHRLAHGRGDNILWRITHHLRNIQRVSPPASVEAHTVLYVRITQC